MSFISHSLQTIFARVFSMALMFVVGIITARWLGPTGDGVLALLILLKNLCLRFGNMGLGSAFVYFLPKYPKCLNYFIRLAWTLGVVLVGACVGIILIIRQMDFSPWKDIQPELFYLALPMVFFFFMNNYFQRILSAQLRITEMNISDLLLAVSTLLLLTLLLIRFDMGLKGAVLSFVLADAIVFVYQVICACRKTPLAASSEHLDTTQPSRIPLYKLLQYGGWNYLAMLTNFLVEELPLIFVKLLVSGNAQVGFFYKARTLGRQSRLVSQPVSQVLFPYTAASKERSSVNRTNTLCRNSFVIMTVLVGASAVFIKPIILFLYGKAFLPSAAIFYCLAPGVILWPALNFLGVHIAAAGRPRELTTAGIVSVIAGVFIFYPAIHRYGPAGAGVSTSVVYLIQLLLRLYWYMKITGSRVRAVLIPQKQDMKHYLTLIGHPLARFRKKDKNA